MWFTSFLALGRLSSCCEELGDVQRAMILCEESLLIASQSLPNGHPYIAECESCWSGNVLSVILMLATVFNIVVGQLASCHRRAGRPDQAIHLTQQCIAILRQSMPSTRKELCTSEC